MSPTQAELGDNVCEDWPV